MTIFCEAQATMWSEVERLEREHNVDLLDLLLQRVEAAPLSDNAELAQTVAVDALSVFNVLIEHSFAMVSHAHAIKCLERLAHVSTSDARRLNAAEQRAFDIESARTYRFVLCVPAHAQRSNPEVLLELWRVLVRLLAEDSSGLADLQAAHAALSCIVDCALSILDELASMCVAQWNADGAMLVQRIVVIASSEIWSSETHVVSGRLAVQALSTLCANAHVLMKIWHSHEIIESVLANIVSSSPLYHDRVHCISRLIERDIEACRVIGTCDVRASLRPVLARYEVLSSIPITERSALLDLLPVVTASTSSTKHFRLDAAAWRAVVETVLYFFEHGSAVDVAAAHTAFDIFMRRSDCRSSLSDVSPILRRIWTSLLRSLERGIVKATHESAFVSFVSDTTTHERRQSDAKSQAHNSRRGSVDAATREPPVTCRAIRLTVSTIVHLGRILSTRTAELRCTQLCVSLLMSRVCYVDSDVSEREYAALSDLLEAIADTDAVFREASAVWVSERHFASFATWLVRSTASTRLPAAQHLAALRLLARLLATSSHHLVDANEDKSALLSALFDIRSVLASMHVDVVDTVWWSYHTTPAMLAAEANCLALWCDLARLACTDATSTRRVLATTLVHHLAWDVLNGCNDVESLISLANQALLALLQTLCRHCCGAHSSTLFDDHALLFRAALDHCMRTVALVPDAHSIKFIAIELLSVFVTHEPFVSQLRRTCHLDHSDPSRYARKTRRNYLSALSDVVMIAQSNTVALEQSLSVVWIVATSELGIAPLLQARNGKQDAMVDLLDASLRASVGTTRKLVLQLEHMQSMTVLVDFLPSLPPLQASVKSCRTALQLLHLCMKDAAFADPMQHELRIFCELFAALGCPDWDITTSAAAVIAHALKWPTESFIGHTSGGDEDATALDEGTVDVERFVATTEPSASSRYRRLAFFANLNDQHVFDIASSATDLPSCFLLLATWVQFYSVNLHLLHKEPTKSVTSSAKRTLETSHSAEETSDGEATPRPALNASTHERHLAHILEILLYVLTNYFGVVYETSEDAPLADEKLQHTTLCTDLLVFCKRRVVHEQHVVAVDSAGIRSRALALVHVLCSFDLHAFAADVFTHDSTISRVLTIVETTQSAQEQRAAVRLLVDVTSYAKVKDLFVSHQTLLLHVCAWLENPRLEALQPFAIGILKTLATKSVGQRRQTVFAFAPSFHDQLAHLLFHGRQFGRKTSVANYTLPTKVVIRRAELVLRFRDGSSKLPLLSGVSAEPVLFPIDVKVHFEVAQTASAAAQRVFQLTSRLQSQRDRTAHSIVLNESDALVRCVVVLTWRSVSGVRSKAKVALTHALEANSVRSLHGARATETTLTLPGMKSTCVAATLSDVVVEEAGDDVGAIGRLLRHEDIDAAILTDATSIVAELCKSHRIFCDDRIRLWDHVLSSMSAHARLRDADKPSAGAVACLQSLSSWLWSKPGVGFFQTSIAPLLRLIQGMRTHGFVYSVASSGASFRRRTRLARPDRHDELDKHKHEAMPMSHEPNFLTGLVDWIAAIESPDVTPNCLNTLFFENTDVLLCLCHALAPHQSPRASFFSLVAAAVRVHMVHCEVFARKHALQRMLSIVNAPPQADESDASLGEMLQSAARAVAKICRHTTARSKFVRHGGLALYGRIAASVCLREWPQSHGAAHAAAENLVLAASFLCDFVTQHAFVDPEQSQDVWWLDRLTSRPPDELGSVSASSAPAPLSVLETLLLFLGRPHETAAPLASNSHKDRHCSSFDRLAAAVVTAVIEKHPRRVAIERKLLELVLDHSSEHERAPSSFRAATAKRRTQHALLTGLERAIALTKWDFDSDLNTIRRTYYAGVCAGVRTGVIPPPCRNVFLRFDQDFLLADTLRQPSVPTTSFRAPSARRPARGDKYAANDAADKTHHSGGLKHEPSRRALLESDDRMDKDVKDLVAFVVEHDELVQTLTSNRKKHLISSIRIADRNARVLFACHTVLSLALDWFVDMIAAMRVETKRTSTSVETLETQQQRSARHTEAVREWLLLLEELSGLVCCALHELDGTYYGALAQQLHALVIELPAFLLKMERIQTKAHASLLFLKNVHSVLKRVANKNELKGVAGNGFGVAEEGKRVCDRLRQLEPDVSDALAYVLSSPSAHAQLARMLVAMDYMWRRVLGSVALSSLMAGAARPTEGLVRKFQRRVTQVLVFLANPGPVFIVQWRKMRAVLAALALAMRASDRASSGASAVVHSVGDASKRPSKDVRPASDRALNTDAHTVDSEQREPLDISHFPFCSLESLLDHYGYASLSAKKIKQTLAIPALKPRVLTLLTSVLGSQESVIERQSVLQLDAAFDRLAREQVATLVIELHALLDGTDAGVYLRQVERAPVERSLWRVVVRPVQRLRLYHLHYELKDLMASDATMQHATLEQYRLDDDAHRSRKDSMMAGAVVKTLTPALAPDSTDQGHIAMPKDAQHLTLAATPPLIKKMQGRSRKHTLLDAMHPFRFTLQVGATTDDVAVSNRHVVAAASDAVFDPNVLAICDRVSLVDPLSEEMAVLLLRRTLRHRKQAAPSGLQRIFSRLCGLQQRSPSSSRIASMFAQLKRRLQLVLLFAAFWRQEELTADLKNELLVKAFDSPIERDEYFLSYHVKKATAELTRVWMPESGNLGLRLWQAQGYLLCGTLASVLVVYGLPLAYDSGSSASAHNLFMTRVIYAYVCSVFALCAASIFVIARSTYAAPRCRYVVGTSERASLTWLPTPACLCVAMAIVL